MNANIYKRILSYKFFMFFCIVSFFLVSCNKNRTSSSLTVLLTDAPANFNQVNIDVAGVELTGADGQKIMLNTDKGIYNLLDYTNGEKTIIATGGFEPAEIEQIRLILGSNNTVMVDSVVYPLSTPSAQQSGLKLQVHKTFEPGVDYSLLLDFDALESVVVKGNGEYQLKPVIRIIETAVSGSIKGNILPADIVAQVKAVRDTLSYSTTTDGNGRFLIPGLPAGTYDVTITPPLPLAPVTLSGKTVTVGATTDLGTIQF